MKYPSHGMPNWVAIQTFYFGLTIATRMNIDTVAGGDLMKKSPNDAQKLIDEIATTQF